MCSFDVSSLFTNVPLDETIQICPDKLYALPDPPTLPRSVFKMLQKLSEKLTAKFPATTRSYSMVKIALLDDAFLEVFKLQASPVEGQSLHSKEKKRRKRKSENRI